MADVEEDRLYLHNLLADLYPNLEIYYQPSTNLTLVYPCIVYSLSDIDSINANNKPYTINSVFKVIVIRQLSDRNGIFLKKMFTIPYTIHNTSFTSDNLVHNQFTITI